MRRIVHRFDLIGKPGRPRPASPLRIPGRASQPGLAALAVIALTIVATVAAGPADAVAAPLTARPAARSTAATASATVSTPAPAPPGGYLTRPMLVDSFDRTSRDGWGAADAGGAYRALGSSGVAGISHGSAYFARVAAGRRREQRASAVVTADLSDTTQFSVPVLPRRGRLHLGLVMRLRTDGRGYAALVHVGRGGRATLTIDRRRPGGGFVTLIARSIPALRARTAYGLQAVLVGRQVWARVWRTAAAPAGVPAAPITWTTVADTSRYAVSGTGRVGVVLGMGGHRHPSRHGRVAVGTVRFPGVRVLVPPPGVLGPPVITWPTPPTPPTPPIIPPSAPLTTPSTTDGSPAGSAAVGSTAYPIPSRALFVATDGSDAYGTGSITAPFATLAAALRASRNGGTIVLRGGTYHQDTLVPRGLQVTIQAYPDEAVWFDGSAPVTGWRKSGSTWIHDGWTARFDHWASFATGSNSGGFVNDAYPMAAWPDQVFVDGAQLQQVAASPSAGEFAVDYGAKQLIVGSDPAGHAVRASDLSQAIVVGGQATLRGFGVRRYATSLPQISTVYFGGDTGHSVVQNVVIDNNAGQGLATTEPGNMIDHVSATNNGMTGMSLEDDDGGVVQNSEMSGNNTQHFNAAPAAAGIKVGRLDGITIRDNLVVDNLEIGGIWTDENTVDFSITGNVVRDNGRASGIANELSGHGIVADNTVTGSRYGYTAMDSGDIEVYNNDFDDNTVWDVGLSQDDRWQPGMGTAGPTVQPTASDPWLVRNVTVADNDFGRTPGAFQFYVLDKQTNRPASSMHLMVEGNLFAPHTDPSRPWPIGWGMGDNVTVHYYATPNAFDTGEGYDWVNMLAPPGDGYSTDLTGDGAVPLPTDVAAAIGQPTGVRHVGVFE